MGNFEMIHCYGCGGPASRTFRTADDVELCGPCYDEIYIDGLSTGDAIDVLVARDPDEYVRAWFVRWLNEWPIESAEVRGVGNMPFVFKTQLRSPALAAVPGGRL